METAAGAETPLHSGFYCDVFADGGAKYPSAVPETVRLDAEIERLREAGILGTETWLALI